MMKNLYQIPFDQYQRYEICARVVQDITVLSGRKKPLKILDVGGFFRNENGSPWLPAIAFLKEHDVLVIDTFDCETEGYMKSDGRNLPFSDGYFDVVISNDVFEHIPPADRGTFLLELIRVSGEYVILNNPHFTAKTASAEKLLYEYLVNVLNHEHDMLGEHIVYGLPSVSETQDILAGFGYKYYFSGDIDNWLYLMIVRHELYSRGLNHETVKLFDAYCNEHLFESEINLNEGYRSTFIISKNNVTDVLENNFLEKMEKKVAKKVELPFATIFNLFALKKENEQKSRLDLFFPNPDEVLPRMANNTKIEQTFVSTNDNLHKVGILCATYQERLKGIINVHITELDTNKVLFDHPIDLSAVEDNKWLFFDFVPLFDSSDKEYKITLEQVTPDPGISLYYSEENHYGSLSFNGNQMAGALSLQVLSRDMTLAEKFYSVQQKYLNLLSSIEQLQQSRGEIEEKLQEIQKQHDTTLLLLEKERENVTLLKELRSILESEISSLKTKNNALESEKFSLETENNALESEKFVLESQKVTLEVEKERITRQLEAAVRENQQQKALLNEKEYYLNEKINEVNLVYNTKSWKLTKCLRWMTQKKRLTFGRVRLLNHLIKKNGGLIQGPFILAYKTLNTIRKEGIGGVKRRVIINRSTIENTPIVISPPSKSSDYFTVGSYVPRNLVLKERTKSVDIVVCVHNALDDVKRCLYSIIHYTKQPYSIIVVDDGSREETKLFLEKMASSQNISLIRNESARGYTFAANQGLKASKADYVVLLNSDTIVTQYWIDKMVACADSDARIGLVGPLSNTASWQSIPTIEQDGDWSDNELPSHLTIADMGAIVEKHSAHTYPRIPFLNGFCMMIKRDLINQIGYFDEENFGRGYGEENDYCLRAQKQGWLLAIADDVYIFHAQSKSYSHEKRKKLVKHADEMLTKKHGQALILQGVHKCQYDRVLQGIRARAQQLFEREYLVNEVKEKWEGLKVVFVLPIIEASGGANVIIQESKAMLEMGIDVRIVNLRRHEETFSRSYNLTLNKVPVIYAEDEEHIKTIVAYFDVVIATSYNSVKWIQDVTPRKVYYIQDFEPYFFKEGTAQYKEAWDSYTLIPDLHRVTKTEWNAKEIKEQIGADATVIGASVNLELFRPRTRQNDEWPKRPLRIAAMIRPSTPRRNPELTMRVLKQVADIYGNKLEIILFGCETNDLEFQSLTTDFHWVNAGVLNSEELAWLLNEVDIFVDFSSFQAMGLTAMEAMANGVAVIAPTKGGASTFIEHGVNGLLVDTQSMEQCVSALKKLISDTEFRTKLQQTAIIDICQFSAEKTVYKLLHAVL